MAQNASKTNPELLPSKDSDRDISFIDYTVLWIGMVINMGAFSIGAQFYPGISPWQLFAAVFVAYGFVTLLLTLTGDIGLRYGISFAVYLRSVFGYKGSKVAALARAIPPFFWFGFQTWIAAIAINKLLVLWTGYSNVTLLVFIFGALQIWNAAAGVKAMAKFNWVAAPILVIFVGGSIFWLLKANNVTLIDILAAPADGTGSFSMAITGIAGIWVTMALNNMDITRKFRRYPEYTSNNLFVRNKRIILGAIIGLITVGAGVLLTGMVGGIVTGVWNPIDIMTKAIPSTIVLVISVIIISFAQFSTGISAALLPTALILINAFPKLSYVKGVIIAGTIGMVTMPWLLASKMILVTGTFSAIIGPLGGLIVADYFLLRKTEFNVEELFDENGGMSNGGYNIKAFITYIVSTALAFVAFKLAFFVGFGVALVLYYVLMKNEFTNGKWNGSSKMSKDKLSKTL